MAESFTKETGAMSGVLRIWLLLLLLVLIVVLVTYDQGAVKDYSGKAIAGADSFAEKVSRKARDLYECGLPGCKSSKPVAVVAHTDTSKVGAPNAQPLPQSASAPSPTGKAEVPAAVNAGVASPESKDSKDDAPPALVSGSAPAYPTYPAYPSYPPYPATGVGALASGSAAGSPAMAYDKAAPDASGNKALPPVSIPPTPPAPPATAPGAPQYPTYPAYPMPPADSAKASAQPAPITAHERPTSAMPAQSAPAMPAHMPAAAFPPSSQALQSAPAPQTLLPAPPAVRPDLRQRQEQKLRNETLDDLGFARKSAVAGRQREAINAYLQHLYKHPNDGNAYGELGNVYMMMGRYPEAAQNYYEAATRLVDAGQINVVMSLLPVIAEHEPMLASLIRQKMARMAR